MTVSSERLKMNVRLMATNQKTWAAETQKMTKTWEMTRMLTTLLGALDQFGCVATGYYGIADGAPDWSIMEDEMIDDPTVHISIY